MNVYKSKYNANSKPMILDKSAISNDDDIKFNIYILPKNTHLYKLFLDPGIFSSMALTVVNCNIFIVTEAELEQEIIDKIEMYINSNIPDVVELKNPINIKPVGYVDSVEKAVNIYKNITIHYNWCSNNLFRYINYRNLNDTSIDEFDEIISYKELTDRKSFNPIFGKVTESRTVVLFNLYPLKSATTVFILPEEFYILPESNNRIALLKVDVFSFWLVSNKSSFINKGGVRPNIESTQFCLASLSTAVILDLYSVFHKYNFNNICTSNSCIYSEDPTNNLLFFVGIYDLPNSFKYGKVFDMITH